MTYQADGYRIGAPVVVTRGPGDIVAVIRERDRARYRIESVASGRRWWVDPIDLRIATAEERRAAGLGEGG